MIIYDQQRLYQTDTNILVLQGLSNVKTWSLHSFFFQVLLLLLPCGKSNCAWTALGSCNPWQMQQNATNSSFSRPLASCKAACPSKACVLTRLERESPQDHLLTRPDDDSTKLTKHTSYHNYVWHQHLSTIINHHNYPVSEPIVPQSWIWWNVGQRLWQAFSQLLVQLHHLAIQKLSNDLHQLIGTLCVAVLFVPGAGCVFLGGVRNIGRAEDTMKIQYGKNTEILHILSGKNRWFRIDVPFNAARSARRLEDLELDPSTPLPSSSNMSAALRVSPSCVIT